jgi:hypothetical protein
MMMTRRGIDALRGETIGSSREPESAKTCVETSVAVSLKVGELENDTARKGNYHDFRA